MLWYVYIIYVHNIDIIAEGETSRLVMNVMDALFATGAFGWSVEMRHWPDGPALQSGSSTLAYQALLVHSCISAEKLTNFGQFGIVGQKTRIKKQQL